MAKPKDLTISIDTFIRRNASLQWQGRHFEANTLRDLANWFVPPFRVDEQAVQAQIAEL